jgi:hypothetical protein
MGGSRSSGLSISRCGRGVCELRLIVALFSIAFKFD